MRHVAIYILAQIIQTEHKQWHFTANMMSPKILRRSVKVTYELNSKVNNDDEQYMYFLYISKYIS